jgi:hypothetical protein
MRGRRVAGAAAVVLALAPVAGCLDGFTQCDGYICPAGLACHPSGVGCADPVGVNVCQSLLEGAVCVIDDISGTCQNGVCIPLECGDGILVSPEQCEPTNLGGLTCHHFGFYEIDGLACSDSCTIDTSACVGRCGDAIVNGPELCDTAVGDVFTCYEIGFDYGTPYCSSTICAPAYDDCRKIGWSTRNAIYDYYADFSSPVPGDLYMITYNGITVHRGPTISDLPVPEGCQPNRMWASADRHVFVSCLDTVSYQFTNSIEHHDGTAWQSWPMAAGTEVGRMWGRTPTDVFALGDEVRHFDGAAWTVVETGAPDGVTFGSMHGNATMHAIATGTGIAIFDGATWTYEVLANANRIWVSPSGTIHAVIGGGAIAIREAPGAYRTVPIPSYIGSIQGLWGLSDRDVYVYGNNRLAHYDGDVWLQLMVPSPAFGWELGGSTEHVIGIYPYGAFHETRGFVWTRPPSPALPPLHAVWAFAKDNIVAFSDGNEHRFDGTAWTSSPLPSAAEVRAVWADDDGTLYAVGPNGALLRYDGTWHDDSIANVNFTAVRGTAPDRVFAVGTHHSPMYRGEIHMWNGTSWSMVLAVPEGYGYDGLYTTPSGDVYTTTTAPNRLLHLAPGADPVTGWTEEVLPDNTFSVYGLWTDGDETLVSFRDRRMIRRVGTGAWEFISSRVPGEGPHGLIGDTDDVWGIADDFLVRWDGTMWDRVRVPQELTAGVASVFASNGIVVVVGLDGLPIQLVRPSVAP